MGKKITFTHSLMNLR